MIMMSVPAQDSGSSRSALGTPRNVASGPNCPPTRVMLPPQAPSVSRPIMCLRGTPWHSAAGVPTEGTPAATAVTGEARQALTLLPYRRCSSRRKVRPRGVPRPVVLSNPGASVSDVLVAIVISVLPESVIMASGWAGALDGRTSWKARCGIVYSAGFANPIGVARPWLASAWIAANTGQDRLVPPIGNSEELGHLPPAADRGVAKQIR